MIKLTVLVAFLSLSLAGPVPQFANKFFAVFDRNESYYGPAGTLSNHEVVVDVPGRRAYVSIASQQEDIDAGYFWLIFAPEGADPGSEQASSFVVFAAKTGGDGNEYCSYTTTADWSSGSFMPPGKFPPQWVTDSGTPTINDWFSFPSNMNYAGAATWHDIPVEEWDSPQSCSVFGQRPTPCAVLMTKKGTNIPVAVQFAHQKRPHSFESDWLSFDQYIAFQTTGVPDIIPPNDQWTSACYNTDNGFLVDPTRGYVSTLDGMDNFTLRLTDFGRPIVSLGDVKLNFVPMSSPSTVKFLLENGADANTLTFNANNFNQPTKIFLKYLADGETYFNIIATGGGYDIPYILTQGQKQPQRETKSASFRAVTCAHGTVGYGC